MHHNPHQSSLLTLKNKIYRRKRKQSLSPGHKDSNETTPMKHTQPFKKPNFNFDNFFNQSMTIEMSRLTEKVGNYTCDNFDRFQANSTFEVEHSKILDDLD